MNRLNNRCIMQQLQRATILYLEEERKYGRWADQAQAPGAMELVDVDRPMRPTRIGAMLISRAGWFGREDLC
jgi:hypothetical protein